ncbi:hypothetical protein RchiOBHm_Chr4g0398361 [Rosa chinensis]|uniref:Uncharacterized protein n=1 Tax=Rosa chinensis TaxID=74649 RepID=A0A2P6QSA3_ROSCH|nr:hypothetical protein RchiOBHm_Chr4g0398361 [Rosa chinensis]
MHLSFMASQNYLLVEPSIKLLFIFIKLFRVIHVYQIFFFSVIVCNWSLCCRI